MFTYIAIWILTGEVQTSMSSKETKWWKLQSLVHGMPRNLIVS